MTDTARAEAVAQMTTFLQKAVGYGIQGGYLADHFARQQAEPVVDALIRAANLSGVEAQEGQPSSRTEDAEKSVMSDAEKLALIGAWMHPGLWSGMDARRAALLRILAGERVQPPEFAREG
ncbi:hypothetical protein [Mycolicibacterium peregrinum]|uniref:Uncharacterized protein n=1 Tax=Mycolicibacterium peregrinum TaxID=43304 RepID=A0A4Z0HKG1_MYCPR|nr:hypothetical protein [Mycolicibacterium peregrinum]TGB37890.1 hypothetical protein EJD98_25410 [Mycolicibacterium peregrinum]TGB38091.1 hypothetical protein EJD94_25155 [Mycolicibacterium peregrinum]